MSESATPEQAKRRCTGRDGRFGAARRAIAALAVCGLAAGLTGCEMDSFMDPSVVGRWEYTPTIVPILERIDVIEHDTGQFVDVTPVMPEDLLPEPTEYRVGPGDVLQIEILDFIVPGQIYPIEEVVSAQGLLDLPQLDPIRVTGMTRQQVEQAIARTIEEQGLLDDPLVTVRVPGQRQATFSVFGVIQRPGTYPIFEPDYRVLRAVTDAGGLSPSIPKIYVIRQVSLADPASPAHPQDGAAPSGPATQPPAPQGPSLIDLIDELTAPPGAPGNATPDEPPPDEPPADELPADEPPIDLDEPSFSAMRSGGHVASARAVAAAASAMQDGQEPPIDLIEEETTRPVITPPQAPAPPSPGRWVFLNGEWVQTFRSAPMQSGAALPDAEDAPLNAADVGALVTQRVIEIPTAPLLQGVAKYNIVIRPGDVIHVPSPSQGLVYITGPGINRPGPYNLPLSGTLTLKRLIASAGGLNLIAIPERVDLTRMVGENRQATIRVNVRAIYEGTHPDLVMKPDDLVNVGTNFWATPLAIIRGGFRTSYGFGFLLDRNFGNDVFGAPPTNQFGQ